MDQVSSWHCLLGVCLLVCFVLFRFVFLLEGDVKSRDEF